MSHAWRLTRPQTLVVRAALVLQALVLADRVAPRVLVDLVHLAPVVLADRLRPLQVLVLADLLLQADLPVPPADSSVGLLSRPSFSAATARTTPSSTADPTFAPVPRSR